MLTLYRFTTQLKNILINLLIHGPSSSIVPSACNLASYQCLFCDFSYLQPIRLMLSVISWCYTVSDYSRFSQQCITSMLNELQWPTLYYRLLDCQNYSSSINAIPPLLCTLFQLTYQYACDHHSLHCNIISPSVRTNSYKHRNMQLMNGTTLQHNLTHYCASP